MFRQHTRLLFASLSLTLAFATTFAQRNLTAKANNLPAVSTVGGETDRLRDGLVGPVRRVRTEVVKLSNVGGKLIEDSKRVLLETSEYDVKGTKTQNQYFPVAGSTLTGREVYKYDDKGNISEMTLMNTDGSLLSKEVYKYEFDSVGNWIKMTTSVAVVGNNQIDFEPTEVTYRTIFYYLDASSARMLQAATASPSPAASSTDARSAVNSSSPAQKDAKTAAALPPSTSQNKLRVVPVAATGVDAQSMNIGGSKKVEVAETEPPPPRPLLKPMSGGVLNGMALSLPAPNYPETARRMHVSGIVEVSVVLDETGKVISATALSGPATLRDVAVQAAYRARFSPTKLSGQPVKVTGQINYKFTLP